MRQHTQKWSPKNRHPRGQTLWLLSKKSTDDKKFREELLKDIREENAHERERYQKLEEQNTQLTKKLENETDPTEKAKIIALINDNKKEMASIKKSEEQRFNKIIGIMNDMSQPSHPDLGKPEAVERKFQAEANKPNLSSWKNWGIIAFVVIIAIMLVSFLKKILSKVTES
ncbi:MAG: hypothetical protein MRECE_12c041, partial [Mycoplasmataceae bacterium CE_OT135]